MQQKPGFVITFIGRKCVNRVIFHILNNTSFQVLQFDAHIRQISSCVIVKVYSPFITCVKKRGTLFCSALSGSSALMQSLLSFSVTNICGRSALEINLSASPLWSILRYRVQGNPRKPYSNDHHIPSEAEHRLSFS